MKFEFYVLNWDFNGNRAKMYNIFNNELVQKYTEKAIKKYLRSPKAYKITKREIDYYGFDALCEEIRSVIMWQEWSRSQYEIVVSDLFSKGEEKWDCYQQAEPNIPMITRECIYQYKQQLKDDGANEK